MRLRGRAADALGALHRLRWPARALAVWGALLLLARPRVTGSWWMLFAAGSCRCPLP